MNTPKPILSNGALHMDDRGSLSFVNDFDFSSIKRFYQAENYSLDTIRAFHGHKKEGKYVYVSSGTALVCAVYIDNFTHPSHKTPVERYILSERKPAVLYIPPLYANGWKALTQETKIIFYSTTTLKDSKEDDYRFPYDYWGTDIWKTENK